MSAAPTEPDYRKLLTHAMAILARAGRIHGETGHMSLVMTSIPNAEDLVGILRLAGCSDITVSVHGFDLIPNPGDAHAGIAVSRIDKGRVYDLDGNEVQGTETLTVRWGEPVVPEPSRPPTLTAVRNHVRKLDPKATVTCMEGGFEIRAECFWSDGWGYKRRAPRNENKALAVFQIDGAFADVLHVDITSGRNGRHIYHAMLAT